MQESVEGNYSFPKEDEAECIGAAALGLACCAYRGAGGENPSPAYTHVVAIVFCLLISIHRCSNWLRFILFYLGVTTHRMGRMLIARRAGKGKVMASPKKKSVTSAITTSGTSTKVGQDLQQRKFNYR